MWKKILDKRLREWKKFCRNVFASSFCWWIRNPPYCCSNSKYVSVKKPHLLLQKPAKSEAEKYKSSLRARYKPIGAVKGEREFSISGYLWTVIEDIRDRKKDWDGANGAKLRELFMTKATSRNVSYYSPSARVPGWAYGVLRQPVQYSMQQNFAIFNVHIITVTHPTFKENSKVAFRHFLCVTLSAEATEVL